MKNILWFIEDKIWGVRCSYNYWLHGPYGLSKVIERMPFRYIIKYLRKYGAKIGENCRFERGINLHRPISTPPYKNLTIGNNVYLGHNILIDLTETVEICDNANIGSRCQIWTHAGKYEESVSKLNYFETKGSVLIDKAAIIYSNVIITHSMNIGQHSKVGACSLVNRNVIEKTFVAGIPIKIILQ